MENGDDNSEKVLILPLNEDSKKITQALSNEKSLKILELLAQDPMSATEIASSLGMPLTTVKYNLDGLIESDLIQVKDTKWSKKGRQIKIYEPVQKLIVVVPGSSNRDRSSIMGMLKKYLGMAAGAIFAAAGIEHLARSSMFGLNAHPSGLEQMPQARTVAADMPADEGGPMLYEVTAPVDNETMEGMPMAAENAMNWTVAPAADMGQNLSTMGMEQMAEPASGLLSHDIFSHFSVWFLLGCLFVILVLCIREVYYRKRS
ncbi:MAG: winged helix-turn-helix domain-containing protein [Euryarchaeota archaeon]|nr:winged helix-turn-helix domain-containing protein [Euryarchaeota archaeon]